MQGLKFIITASVFLLVFSSVYALSAVGSGLPDDILSIAKTISCYKPEFGDTYTFIPFKVTDNGATDYLVSIKTGSGFVSTFNTVFIDGKTKKPVWDNCYEASQSHVSAVILEDMNFDGTKEVIMMRDGHYCRVLDVKTATLSKFDTWRCFEVKPLINRDDKAFILLTSSEVTKFSALYDYKTEGLVWQTDVGGKFNVKLDTYDSNNDGIPEIFYAKCEDLPEDPNNPCPRVVLSIDGRVIEDNVKTDIFGYPQLTVDYSKVICGDNVCSSEEKVWGCNTDCGQFKDKIMLIWERIVKGFLKIFGGLW